MKFSESYIGQPIFITNDPSKIGYIKNLSMVQYYDTMCDDFVIENVYVVVDRGSFEIEYGIDELTPAKGNM